MRAEHAVEIRSPQRGSKKALVEQAVSNAREALGRKLAETRSQAQLLDGVQKVFGLPRRPERIEVYDNSHIQGSNALGAMIVAGPEGFEKTSYRRFNMKGDDAATNDDFAMMKAMLRRRLISSEASQRPTPSTKKWKRSSRRRSRRASRAANYRLVKSLMFAAPSAP